MQAKLAQLRVIVHVDERAVGRGSDTRFQDTAVAGGGDGGGGLRVEDGPLDVGCAGEVEDIDLPVVGFCGVGAVSEATVAGEDEEFFIPDGHEF